MYDLIVTYSLFFQMTYALIIDILDKDDGGKNGKIFQLIFQWSLFMFILVSWIHQVLKHQHFIQKVLENLFSSLTKGSLSVIKHSSVPHIRNTNLRNTRACV